MGWPGKAERRPEQQEKWRKVQITCKGQQSAEMRLVWFKRRKRSVQLKSRKPGHGGRCWP